MLASERERVLEKSVWSPRDSRLGYIEAITYKDPGISHASRTGAVKHGYLSDDEVADWLSKRDGPANEGGWLGAKPMTRLRIVLCQRLSFNPLSFAMSQQSYLAMEEAFNLPPETLPVFDTHAGQEFCKFNQRPGEGGQEALSLSVIIRRPQMIQVGNMGLSMTYDFHSRSTTAFLHGWDIFGPNLRGVSDLSHFTSFVNIIEDTISLWDHPLFIPTLMLKDHISRAHVQIGFLSREVLKVEDQMGVTRASQLKNKSVGDMNRLKKMITSEESLMAITSVVNTTSTDAINTQRVLAWDLRYVSFMRRVSQQINYQNHNGNSNSYNSDELLRYIDFAEGQLESAREFVVSLQSRLDLQLNVLYNFIAHAGNELNSKIAAAAGLDSAAMKTLAVVTIAFLPATFIATLFSMPTFDWDSSWGQVVNPKLWAYWVVSVPLTLLIIMGWRIWWRFQKNYYARKYLNPYQSLHTIAGEVHNRYDEESSRSPSPRSSRNGDDV